MTEQLLDKVKEYIQAKQPCVVYCKPGSNIVTGIFQRDSVAYAADFSAEGFMFAPFADGDTLFIPYYAADVLTAKVDVALDSAEADKPGVDIKAKADFESLVAQSINVIKSGKFEKLVCSRTEIVEVKTDIASIFIKMLNLYPNAFRYCFYHPASGLWMGATPEQLLKAKGKTIHTVALAGTQLYVADEEAFWQEKDKQEQQFVTDYIASELQGLAENINTSFPYTYRAGNLVHIKTDIKAEINSEAVLSDVIKTLHPTPAVCGLPTNEARKFLLQNENYERQYYSGFLGEVNRDFAANATNKTDLFVNLRCMKIQGKNAQLFVGCGITIDSDPEKEFVETMNKSMTMRRVL